MVGQVSRTLFEKAREWAAADPDPQTSASLEAWVRGADEREVRCSFEPPMEFGTAGLRGIVGPGPARMNQAVIRRVSRALADQVQESCGPRCKVVVGCDARLDSNRFCREAAGVLAAAGCSVITFDEPVATPMVAFVALREGAAAGVVVTASHNPPEYNGYKVFGGNAIQIVPPFDSQIAQRMARLPGANSIAVASLEPNGTQVHEILGDEWLSIYDEAVLSARPAHAHFPLRIAYTPLHGVGWRHARGLLRAAGYADLHPVPSQVVPDGHFPTVNFPNPEEPGTLKLGMHYAAEVQAHLLIANDPDADRLAMALPDETGHWHAISGNHLGVILTDYLLGCASSQSLQSLVVSTVVSTPMVDKVAAAYHARLERTLTGFKWLWTAALELLKDESLAFAIAWEEALGYSTHTGVRDKDGIAAALIAADWAASCLASGHLPYTRLGRLFREHGAWASRQVNIQKAGIEGLRELRARFERLSTQPPTSIAGVKVTDIEDYRIGAPDRPYWRGAADLAILHLSDGSRVLARPSGTEPKLKLYLDVPAEVRSGEDPFEVLRRAEVRAEEMGAFLLDWLGN